MKKQGKIEEQENNRNRENCIVVELQEGKMYCRNCGNEIDEAQKYCIHCGAVVEELPEATVSASDPVQEMSGSNKGKLPLYIGLGIVGLVVVCTCIFLVMHTLSEDEKADTGSAVPVAQQQETQQQETQPVTSESAKMQPPSEGNTYNNYYYYNTGYTGSYENSSLDGYLWPTDSAYIEFADLSSYSRKQVAAIRNEIYARHGYVFKTREWSNYFNQRSWYTPNYSYTDDWLSDIERTNIETIVAYEKSQGWK